MVSILSMRARRFRRLRQRRGVGEEKAKRGTRARSVAGLLWGVSHFRADTTSKRACATTTHVRRSQHRTGTRALVEDDEMTPACSRASCKLFKPRLPLGGAPDLQGEEAASRGIERAAASSDEGESSRVEEPLRGLHFQSTLLAHAHYAPTALTLTSFLPSASGS